MRYPVTTELKLRDLDDADGWAACSDEAQALVNGKSATLEVCETRYTYRSLAEVQRHWSSEVASGLVQARQCYHGWVLDLFFWRVEV